MASLIVKITGDASGFKSTIDSAGRSLDSLAVKVEKVSGAISTLGATMSVSLTAPILAMGTVALKASADMDSLQRALVTTTGSAAEAEKQFARLQEIAKLPAIGLEEAVRGSIRLQNYGLSAELAEKALKGFSNAVGASGGSSDDTNESLRQLGQTFGRQKVTMDNLRIILERVPQAAKIIREEFGSEALADPAKALEKLGVNSEKFVTVLINRLAEAPKVTAGLKTEFENLGQDAAKAAARIGDQLAPAIRDLMSVMSEALKKTVDLADGFAKMPKPLQDTILAMGGLAVTLPLVAVAFGTVITNIGVISTAAGTITTAVAGFATTIGTYGIATSAAIGVMAGAWIAAAAVAVYSVGTLVSAMYELYAANTKLDTSTNSLSFSVEKLLSSVRKQHPEVGALELRYRAGSLSADEFSTELLRLASGMESTTIQTPKAARTIKDFGDQLNATNKIVVDSVAGLDARGNLSKTSLVYIEMLERTKAGVSKLKDAIYDYLTAGSIYGKQIETHVVTLDASGLAAREYAARLGDVRRELENMPAAKVQDITVNQRRGTVVEATDILGSMGGKSSQAAQQEISDLEAKLARIKELNQQDKASGDDVIQVQEKLRKAMEESGNAGVKNAKRTGEAWKQVSTIATDLSRGIANAGVGLLFSKGAQVDVQKYKDEISALEAEQQKLLVSQSKGNDVTKQLAANSAKLADVNKRMADEVKKASFSFRALEAGKSIVEDLAKSITRVLIEGALKSLAKNLLGVGTTATGVFGGISSQISGVFGGGSSGGTSTIFSAASSAGGAGASAGGGIASAAGSAGGAIASGGITAVVGAVAGVVSAVSSVVANFQFAHMNTALGRIEESTRYVKIWTGEQSQSLLWCAQKSTEYLGYAVKSLDQIGLLNSQMLGMMQAGGGAGGTTINMAGAYLLTDAALDDFIERFSRRLKTQGL